MKVFLDVCCLNRPFDDRSQTRISMEIEAIQHILQSCQDGEFKLIDSDTLQSEISRDPDRERQLKVRSILSLAKIRVRSSENLKKRTKELINLGFTPYDAAHLASAELGRAGIFLSTDDKLVKRAKNYKDQIKVAVDNPVSWIVNVYEKNDNA